MKDDVASLDEVVVVGYGTQKRGSITGAISTVSDKELLKAPTMSISNVVGARLPELQPYSPAVSRDRTMQH